MLLGPDPLLMRNFLLVSLSVLYQRLVLVINHISRQIFLIRKPHMRLLVQLRRLIKPIQQALIA